MTLTILPDLEQGSAEWLDQRRGMVTASVVGQLLTPTGRVASNDYSRALTARLVAERITGYTDDTFQNADLLRGVMEEPRARDKYAEVTGRTVQQVGFMVLEGDGWRLGASPDGLVDDDGGIEVKSPRAKGHLQTILADTMPAHHVAQVQACLLVSGRKWWDFISWHGGMPMYVKRVLPEPVWHEAITEAVAGFEREAARMVERYETATKHLPPTERMAFFEEIVI